MVKNAFKVVVAVTLLAMILLAGTAQAKEKDLKEYSTTGIFDVFGSLVQAGSGLLEKMRDVSDEDLTAVQPMAAKKPE